MANQYKRKIHYIKRDFQFKFIIKYCILILMGSGVSTALLFYFSKGTLTSTFQNSRLVIKNTSIAIMPAVLTTNLITLVLITIAVIFVTLYVSHKIAGPIYRFEQDLIKIGEGDLVKKISIRKNDQFIDLVSNINTMTSGLHDKISDINKAVRVAQEKAINCKASDEVINEFNLLIKKINMTFKL